MNGKIKYEFSAKMWKHSLPGSWHFFFLPKNISKEIRENLKWQEEGWGRMKALAKIEQFEWKTAIWFDTKINAYLLPIKAEARKKSNLEINKIVKIEIWA